MSSFDDLSRNLLLTEGGYPHLPKSDQQSSTITFKASLYGYCYIHETGYLGDCVQCCINKANELDGDRQ